MKKILFLVTVLALQSCSVLDSISPKWHVGKWKGIDAVGTRDLLGNGGLTDFKYALNNEVIELTKDGEFNISDNTGSISLTYSISGSTFKSSSGWECTINKGTNNEMYLDFNTEQYNEFVGTRLKFATLRRRYKKV